MKLQKKLLSEWDLRQFLFVSRVLNNKHVTVICCAGPHLHRLSWKAYPKKLSLFDTATASLDMLTHNEEQGSAAGALRCRLYLPNLTATHYIYLLEI